MKWVTQHGYKSAANPQEILQCLQSGHPEFLHSYVDGLHKLNLPATVVTVYVHGFVLQYSFWLFLSYHYRRIVGDA